MMTEKKRTFGLSGLALKIIACLLMTLDHIALLFIPGEKDTYTLYYILRAIGKISFPIFAFLAVEGAYKTNNILKYLLRLFIFAIVLDGFGYTFGSIYHINVIDNPLIGNAFTDMFLGVLTVHLLKKKNWYSLFALFPIAISVLSDIDLFQTYGSLFKTDWGTFSIVLFIFYFLAKELSSLFIRKRTSMTLPWIMRSIKSKQIKCLKSLLLSRLNLPSICCGVSITVYLSYQMSLFQSEHIPS